MSDIKYYNVSKILSSVISGQTTIVNYINSSLPNIVTVSSMIDDKTVYCLRTDKDGIISGVLSANNFNYQGNDLFIGDKINPLLYDKGLTGQYLPLTGGIVNGEITANNYYFNNGEDVTVLSSTGIKDFNYENSILTITKNNNDTISTIIPTAYLSLTGGVINGQLKVISTVSASNYKYNDNDLFIGDKINPSLYDKGLTGDYLPLTGGTINGQLKVISTVSASNYKYNDNDLFIDNKINPNLYDKGINNVLTISSLYPTNANMTAFVSGGLDVTSSYFNFGTKDNIYSKLNVFTINIGTNNTVSGYLAYAHGKSNKAVGRYSVADGYNVTTLGDASHAEGSSTEAAGIYSHAEGENNHVYGQASHVEGKQTIASGNFNHAEGYYTVIENNAAYSHAEGHGSKINAQAAHAEGRSNNVSGKYAHAEGYYNTIYGEASHAEGANNIIYGKDSHSEGQNNIISGNYAHAEGRDNINNADYSHTEGVQTNVYAYAGHAEGHYTDVSGQYGHAEGYYAKVIGDHAHAEGCGTLASGQYSHAEGQNTQANGQVAHAEGYGTQTINELAQHVEGKFNIPLTGYQKIVGGGTSDSDRKNIYTLDWSGNQWLSGTISATNYFNSNGDKLFIDNKINPALYNQGLSGDYLPLTGGIVNGQLKVTNTVSASNYKYNDNNLFIGDKINPTLYNQGLTGQYLPLTGGIINGSLNILNNVSASEFIVGQHKLSQKITSIIGLSAINISGNVLQQNIYLTIDKNDKFLSQSESGLKTTLSLSSIAQPVTGIYAKQYCLVDKNGEQVGERIDIQKDKFLSGAYYKSDTHQLILNLWNASGGITSTVISLEGLTNIYTATSGVKKLADGKTFVGVLNNQSQSYLTLDENGFKLSGVYSAITSYVDNTLTGKVDKVSGYSLIADTQIQRLSSVVNYDDAELRTAISGKQNEITSSNKLSYDLISDGLSGSTNIDIINKQITLKDQISVNNILLSGNALNTANGLVQLNSTGKINNTLIDSSSFSTIDTIKVNNITQEIVDKTVNLNVIQNPTAPVVGEYLRKTATGWQTADGIATVTKQVTSANLVDNKLQVSNTSIPVTVKTNKGNIYPIQKNTLTQESTYFYIDTIPYLVYDNETAFSGTWTIYFGAGVAQRNTNTVCSGVTENYAYYANYDNGDIHCITPTNNIELIPQNIPIGEGLSVRVDNTAGVTITFNSVTVISEAGNYIIPFGNMTGTIQLLGGGIRLY